MIRAEASCVMPETHVLLLTGAPGVGKTTLMRRVAERLSSGSNQGPPARLAGFITDEIREGERRVGFRIVPLRGPPRVLAHVDFGGSARVGRYGVAVSTVDEVAESALDPGLGVDAYLLDEIGKMECFSPRFVAAVQRLLGSGARVVATVAKRGGGLIEEVKARPDAELWEVTPRNREVLVDRVLRWLEEG
jgi:nucleoside-triphosphatase